MYDDMHDELVELRKEQPIDIINLKKRMVWQYFGYSLSVPIYNLEKNISRKFSLFYAPVRQIKGTNMTCWPLDDETEIYIDENFAINNPQTANVQTTHEVLHGLSQMKGKYQYFFGHQYQGGKNSLYSGLNEATTQLFAEDIEQHRLNENEDYLYFVKNVMRIMKVAFGIDKLANQYLNNDTQFEQAFDKSTNGKFSSFASMMNDIYLLSKAKHYSKISDENIKLLDMRKEQVINLTNAIVETFSHTNPQLKQEIVAEVQDDIFLSKFNIKAKEIEYAYYLHGTANESPEVIEDVFNNGLILEGDTALRLHSTLAPISEEAMKTRNLGDIMHEYSQLEDFNSVFLIKIPKEYLSCKPHRDGSVDIPMPLWKNIDAGKSVLTPHLIQGVYNRHIDRGISNPNFSPLYNPNGMAYSIEQFYSFSSYNRTDLMAEYKQRQFTSFSQQYANDNASGTFNQVIRYYQSKFGQLSQPQLFDSSEYRMLLEQTMNQNNNFKK